MRIVDQREWIQFRDQFRDLGWASVSYKMSQLYCFCIDFVKSNDTTFFFEKDAALQSEHEACLTACSVCRCVRTLLHWNMQHAALGLALVTAGFLENSGPIITSLKATLASHGIYIHGHHRIHFGTLRISVTIRFNLLYCTSGDEQTYWPNILSLSLFILVWPKRGTYLCMCVYVKRNESDEVK